MAAGNRRLQVGDEVGDDELLTAQVASEELAVSTVTASKLLEEFRKLGLVKEITGWKRNRRYRYDPYLQLFAPPFRRHLDPRGEEPLREPLVADKGVGRVAGSD